MSPSMERLLRRMISPNADLRYTSSEAMADNFWQQTESDAAVSSHSMFRFDVYIRVLAANFYAEKSSSVSYLRSAPETEPSIITPMRVTRNFWDDIKPSTEKTKIPVSADKENVASTPSTPPEKSRSVAALTSSIPRHKRAQSQATQTTECKPLITRVQLHIS
jgi:serine/threonine protein kinase